MVAVSNTSPISNLAYIRRLDLLKDQFSEILIPEAVRNELGHIPDQDAKTVIMRAFEERWIICRAVNNPRLADALGGDLDKGEAEAIALAAEIRADLLLIDEKAGRRFARNAGFRVSGVLGVLIRAKETGQIPFLQAEINALRSRAGFFIAGSLETAVLRAVGE